jgi:signal transduction histidine kinase
MWQKLQVWIKKFEKPLTTLAGSVCLTALLLNFDFNFLEANLYDLRVSHGMQSKPNPDIVLVTLDDATTKELDEFAPLSMDFHARFLETIEQMEPKAVGYLIDMNHVSQMNADVTQKDWVNRFVQAAERMEARGSVFLLGTPFDVTGEILPPFPLSSLPHAVAVVHKDGNVFSEDKITRRALLTLYERPAFHLNMAQRLGYLQAGEMPNGSFYVPEVDGKYFFFRYHDSTVLHHDRPRELPYKRYSFADTLRNRIPPGSLKDKIVLVGTLSRDDSADFALTPYSKSAFSNPKIIVHANILDSVISKDGIVRAPASVNWLVTFLVTSIVLWWIMTSTPLYGVFATIALALSFIFISQIFFQVQGIWIKESQPLVGIFVGYYLAVPYRLIREYKKRWDYQRKNELLTQVEELKTNFLSLVTHDLKTPVARIQGLSEVLLRTASERLQASDQMALKNIISSSDELNHFISSILELSKVESNHLHIRIESKDINHLIERSIDSFRTAARAQDIEILTNLEPLFPVRIDPSLISKVLNNLIDNSIKYSPPHSKIYIDSREENDWIVVSIRDQGIGMTQEEKGSLFTRFYRAKNDSTTTISGSGLGLYLTKYFIETHRGRVEVESEKGKGSTFKIYLPLRDSAPHLSVSNGLTRNTIQVKPNLRTQFKESSDV